MSGGGTASASVLASALLAPRDEELAFAEPWQAQTLALAANLVQAGVFSAAQWSEHLGAALRAAQAEGRADDLDTYYAAALAALETLLAAQGAVPAEVLSDRTEAWRRAYLKTPHGSPVELVAGLPE